MILNRYLGNPLRKFFEIFEVARPIKTAITSNLLKPHIF